MESENAQNRNSLHHGGKMGPLQSSKHRGASVASKPFHSKLHSVEGVFSLITTRHSRQTQASFICTIIYNTYAIMPHIGINPLVSTVPGQPKFLAFLRKERSWREEKGKGKRREGKIRELLDFYLD